VRRERELAHDVQIYRAYEREAERLAERGARIERVILDYELKPEYQKWLHERDRDRDDYDGHPDRTAEEIREWALEHELPDFLDPSKIAIHATNAGAFWNSPYTSEGNLRNANELEIRHAHADDTTQDPELEWIRDG
jgi:hypothetical protein